MKNVFIITISLFLYHVVIAQNTATSIRGTFFDGAEDHPSFEINSTYNSWSFIDGDNSSTYQISGVTFPGSSLPMAYIIFSPSETTPPMTVEGIQPHSGNKFFAFIASNEVQPNNDWLISPMLNNPTKFSFWAKSYLQVISNERMRVAYSVFGKEEGDFIIISGTNSISVPKVWTYYVFDIPQEAKYVAINYVSNDMFMLMVDDITIEQLIDTCEAVNDLASEKFNINSILLTWTKPESDLQIEGYRIFRNGQLLNEDLFTVTTYFDENLPDGEYEYCVVTYYNNGCISDTSNYVAEMVLVGVNDVAKINGIVIYPNPNNWYIANCKLRIASRKN